MVGDIRSKTARRLIEQRVVLHRGDLEANWARMKRGERWSGLPHWSDGAAMIMPTVISADYRGGTGFRLSFSDGTVKTVDFRKWLHGPIFEPSKDPSYFHRFFLEAGTVVWPNGADSSGDSLRGGSSSHAAVQQPDAAGERRRAQTERRAPLMRGQTKRT
jgi:Protein of unknown function (DUF2442)